MNLFDIFESEDELFAESPKAKILAILHDAKEGRKKALERMLKAGDYPEAQVVAKEQAMDGIDLIAQALKFGGVTPAAKEWNRIFYAKAYSGEPGAAELSDEGLEIAYRIKDEAGPDFFRLSGALGESIEDDMFSDNRASTVRLPEIVEDFTYNALKMMERPEEFLQQEMGLDIEELKDEEQNELIDQCQAGGDKMAAVAETFKNAGIVAGLQKLKDMFNDPENDVASTAAIYALEEFHDVYGIDPQQYLSEEDDMFAPASKSSIATAAKRNIVGKVAAKGRASRKTDTELQEIVAIAEQVFGRKYSSGTISGGKVYRISLMTRGLGDMYHYSSMSSVSKNDKIILGDQKKKFFDILNNRGLDTSRVDVKYHMGATLYTSVRIKMKPEAIDEEDDMFAEPWRVTVASLLAKLLANPHALRHFEIEQDDLDDVKLLIDALRSNNMDRAKSLWDRFSWNELDVALDKYITRSAPGIELFDLLGLEDDLNEEDEELFAPKKYQADLTKINSAMLRQLHQNFTTDIRPEYASKHKLMAARIAAELERRGEPLPTVMENDDMFAEPKKLSKSAQSYLGYPIIGSAQIVKDVANRIDWQDEWQVDEISELPTEIQYLFQKAGQTVPLINLNDWGTVAVIYVAAGIPLKISTNVLINIRADHPTAVDESDDMFADLNVAKKLGRIMWNEGYHLGSLSMENMKKELNRHPDLVKQLSKQTNLNYDHPQVLWDLYDGVVFEFEEALQRQRNLSEDEDDMFASAFRVERDVMDWQQKAMWAAREFTGFSTKGLHTFKDDEHNVMFMYQLQDNGDCTGVYYSPQPATIETNIGTYNPKFKGSFEQYLDADPNNPLKNLKEEDDMFASNTLTDEMGDNLIRYARVLYGIAAERKIEQLAKEGELIAEVGQLFKNNGLVAGARAYRRLDDKTKNDIQTLFQQVLGFDINDLIGQINETDEWMFSQRPQPMGRVEYKRRLYKDVVAYLIKNPDIQGQDVSSFDDILKYMDPDSNLYGRVKAIADSNNPLLTRGFVDRIVDGVSDINGYSEDPDEI
jgi:hypothetical protein